MTMINTHPRLRFTQLHYRPPNISRSSPTLNLIPSPPDTRLPAINIDRKRVLARGHEGLGRRQEVIRQPAHVEKRPLDLRLSSQRPSYRLAGTGIEVRLQWVGFHVADPFRGNEALAGAGEGAGGQESGVGTDVGGVG